MTSIIIGGAASVVQSLIAQGEATKKEADSIQRFLSLYRVPTHLSKLVRAYHRYYSTSKAYAQTAPWLAQMPESLRMKLNLAIKRPLIEKIP